MLRLHRFITLGATLTVAIACGSTEPEPEATLDYETTQWLISSDGTVTDALAAGAMIDLVMRPGIVNGMLFIPAAITGTTDFSANLAGSWIKKGDTIRFNEVSLSFVSDLDWILTPETLSAADSVDDSFYDIVLTRIF